MPTYEPEHEEAVVAESRHKLKRPPLYKVLIHNDNFTTMEFVVFVLQEVFQHSETVATIIMLQVHTQGVGVAGVYPFEIAEMKVSKVTNLAQAHEFPLLCTMEETQTQG